ncbi:protein zer-1 homolog [Antedon mediterranea]|uniref:protein zer-1 homolog n=1 Tax=Antedon mediterranea TaxID=105859 RepID=UPI003AF903BA
MTGSNMINNDNNPIPLADQLIGFIANNPSSFCVMSSNGEHVKLREDVVLCSSISDKLMSLHAESENVSESFMKLFTDTNKAHLKRMEVANTNITDRCLMYVRKQKLVELNLSNCSNLTPCGFQYVNEQTELQVLKLENTSIIQGYKNGDVSFRRLRLLNLSSTGVEAMQLYCIVRQLEHLKSLDVSNIVKNGDLMFLDPVRSTLKSLVLHDCILVQHSLEYLCKLVNLSHLDISSTSDDKLNIKTEFLKCLCQNLQNLMSLDLSGNLVEKGIDGGGDQLDMTDLDHESAETNAERIGKGDLTSSRIEGLRGLQRPLHFLGLLNCPGCDLENLPALKVAGEANEDQVLNAIEAYTSRSTFLLKALNVFFEVVRTANCKQIPRAANLIVVGMKTHLRNCPIQISGSASLYHICCEPYQLSLSFKTKRLIIVALLDAMENNPKSLTLQRNCCLTLYNQLPFNLQFQYKRFTKILINIINSEGIDNLVERLCVFMCNNIVCHVEGEEKKLMGKLGVVKSMLRLIKKRVDRRTYDEVMETAWSTLWNVTDETADNCQMFVSGGGLHLFQQCRMLYPDRQELLRNMMGLMGNVAEVPFLRPDLLYHVETFCVLLFDKSDGIEVSYNAAGVLSHILSDGPHKWDDRVTGRVKIIEKIQTAIDQWDIKTKRNINYRSFEPIIRLLDKSHTPICQYWAVWALTNLCHVDPDKYCSLLRKEGGLEKLLQVLREHQTAFPKLADLANRTIHLNKEILGPYNFQ